MDKNKEIEDEGKASCLTYGSQYLNPYDQKSPDYNSWDRGWSQAMKRYPSKVFRIDRDRQQAQDSIDNQNMKQDSITTDLYRKLKGK
jgi:hypothetical protein